VLNRAEPLPCPSGQIILAIHHTHVESEAKRKVLAVLWDLSVPAKKGGVSSIRSQARLLLLDGADSAGAGAAALAQLFPFRPHAISMRGCRRKPSFVRIWAGPLYDFSPPSI
jgi:hypothetical protein